MTVTFNCGFENGIIYNDVGVANTDISIDLDYK